MDINCYVKKYFRIIFSMSINLNSSDDRRAEESSSQPFIDTVYNYKTIQTKYLKDNFSAGSLFYEALMYVWHISTSEDGNGDSKSWRNKSQFSSAACWRHSNGLKYLFIFTGYIKVELVRRRLEFQSLEVEHLFFSAGDATTTHTTFSKSSNFNLDCVIFFFSSSTMD